MPFPEKARGKMPFVYTVILALLSAGPIKKIKFFTFLCRITYVGVWPLFSAETEGFGLCLKSPFPQ
jgi:hypothetical protein